MAKKKVKQAVKKVVKKVLDSTELDEKIVAEYNEHKSIIDLVLCYIKCYGGYVLAAGWAYKVRSCKPCCNGGVCEPKEDCCK